MIERGHVAKMLKKRSQFHFSNIIVLTLFIYEPKFYRQISLGNDFRIFGGKADIAEFQMIFWPPF